MNNGRVSGGGVRFRPSTSIYVAGAILALTVFAQATLAARIRLSGSCPNLILVVVVGWSLVRGVEEGILWGFGGGLLFDLVAGLPLGTSSIALMLVSLLPGLGEGRLFQGHMLLPVAAIALATPIYGGVVVLIEQIRGFNTNWPAVATGIVLPELVLNGAAIILLYPVLRRLGRLLGGDQMEW